MGTPTHTMSAFGKELGDLLLDNGLVTEHAWKTAQEEYLRTREPIAEILSRLGIVTKNQLKDTLELQYGVNYFSLDSARPDITLASELPEAMMRELRVMPVARQGDCLTVAMVNPDDLKAEAAVKARLPDYQIKKMVCTEDNLIGYLELFKKEAVMVEEKQEAKPAPLAAPKPGLDAKSLFGSDDDDDDFDFDEPKDTLEMPQGNDEAALMNFANQLISKAIDKRCSDMNVEPEPSTVTVRYLTNKEIVAQSKVPKEVHPELVFCYKVIAGLNINEHSRPQDRKTIIKIAGEDIELRVTSIPGEHGETVAISFKYGAQPQ